MRDFAEIDADTARTLTESIVATVLSNRRPPYSITGGMFDVLRESQGDMFAVDNEDALQAIQVFEKCEGIDIDPAAGVALAALVGAASTGQIDSEAVVLLHITGGGAAQKSIGKEPLPGQARHGIIADRSGRRYSFGKSVRSLHSLMPPDATGRWKHAMIRFCKSSPKRPLS